MVRLFNTTLLLFAIQLNAQNLPKVANEYGLDSLSELQQVTYINDNFHEIYSHGFSEAIELSQYAIDISKVNSWKKEEGYSLMCYGIARYLKGDYEDALIAFNQSSDTFDSLVHHKGIARINNELAVFYRKQKDFDKVYSCLDKSEQAAKIIDDKESLSTTYHHLGVVLSQNGQYEGALPFFEKVLEIRTELKDSVGLGYIYLDFAEYEVHNNRIDAALQYIEKSSQIRKKLGDLQGLAVNEVIKGETLFAAGDHEASINYFKNTIELAKPIGYTDLIRFAYDMLQQAYTKTDNYVLAYENLLKSVALNDSLFNIEKTRSLLELQTKYETEKKEKQIALQEAKLRTSQLLTSGLAGIVALLIVLGFLQRNRLLLKQQKLLEEEKAKTREAQIKAALSSQESERKRFARDLHDGFGQFISVLNLNLKALEKGNSNPEKVFEDSSKVLDQMYKELKEICFNLMPETLVKYGIVEGLKEFASRINRVRKIHIVMDIFGIDERLQDLQEISIYRITQEWINNILKYSDANKVTISLTRDEEEITLLIEDNGSGFDRSKLVLGKGNGWKNMNSRTNLIKGELELDTTVGNKGTTLIINAPVYSISQNKEIVEQGL